MARVQEAARPGAAEVRADGLRSDRRVTLKGEGGKQARQLSLGIALQVAALTLILGVYGWLALGYAEVTPPWNNPDEPAHFNYVRHIAETGTLPVIQAGDWDQALLERLVATQFRLEESIGSIQYESWQPPLYYLVAVPVYALAPAGDLAAQVRALRLFDVALGAMTVLLVYLAARELFIHLPILGPPPPGRFDERAWLALAAPAVVVGIPMFTALSAAINNDALANLVGALLTLLLLRLLRTRPTFRQSMLAGALVGGALLTKLTLGIFVPLVLATLLLATYRAGGGLRRGVRLALAALVTMLVVLAPWLVRQGLTYGWGDLLAKARHDAVVVGQPRTPGFSEEHLWYLATTTFHSFWAQFGWMGIPVASWLYWVWGGLSLGALLGLVVYVGRVVERFQALDPGELLRHVDPRPGLLAAIFGGMIGVAVYHNLTFVQAQGRYVFPSLAALCLLYVLGWSSLTPRLLRLPVLAVTILPLWALNAYALTRSLAPAFAGP